MKLADRSDLKLANRKTVYAYICNCDEQTASCAQISRATGISLSTVIKITGYFEKRGLLQDLGTQKSASVGRHPSMLKFVPDAFCSLGLAYDGKHLDIVCVNLNYTLMAAKRVRVNSQIDTLMAHDIAAELDIFLQQEGIELKTLLGIGVALPVVMDTHRCATNQPAPLVGIRERHDFAHHRDALAERFGCPVFMENDVNAAAVGEFRERGLGAVDDLAYITLGTGIGSGILLNGRLRRGSSYAAGEIGNMVFSGSSAGPEHPVTLENSLSPEMLEKLFGMNVYADAGENSPSTVARAADYVARNLAFAIHNMASILDIRLFVLGGFVVEALGEQVYLYTEQYLQCFGTTALEVQPAAAAYSSARGAGAQAVDKALASIMSSPEE